MLALTLATLLSPAFAASNEVSFEVSWIGSQDPSWDYFASGAHGSYGLRAGYAVHPNVAIIAGWQHAVHGGGTSGPAVGADLVTYGGSGDDEGYYESEDAFFAAMYTDQLSAGAKADVKLFKWLHPYATLQLVGMRGLVRLDDDLQDDENLTQVETAGLTGGFTAGAGLDFPIHVAGRWAIAPYVELGYGWLAPMKLENLGSVQFSGFAGRTGVGVRF